MKFSKKLLGAVGAAGLLSVGMADTAFAAPSDETAFVFNTLLFLIGGFLVMFMAAGFCMLEVGMVRSKNAATICVKNIGLYSIAGLMYYAIGYKIILEFLFPL